MLMERFPPTSGQSPWESGGCSPHLVCGLRRGQDIPRVYLAREAGPQVQDLPARQGFSSPKSGTETAGLQTPRNHKHWDNVACGLQEPATPTQIRTEQVSNDGYESAAPQLVEGGLGLTFNLM